MTAAQGLPAALAGVPFDAYRALDGLNWSTLKHALRSQAHFAAALAGTLDDPDTLGRRALRAVHAAVLEPDQYERQYKVWAGRRAGKEYEAAAGAAGAPEYLTVAEDAHARAVAAAVHGHPAAGLLLRAPGVVTELTVTWPEEGHGHVIACKGRIDAFAPRGCVALWPDGLPCVIDLKAVPAVGSGARLASEIARRDYAAQLAHYAAGIRAVWEARPGAGPWPGARLVIIAYEVKPIPDVAVVDLGVLGVREGSDGEAAYFGGRRRSEALAAAAPVLQAMALDGHANGPWPGQAPGVVEVGVPGWAYGDDDANDALSGLEVDDEP